MPKENSISQLKKSWNECVTELSKEYPKASKESLCSFFGYTRQAWYKTDSDLFKKFANKALLLDEIANIRTNAPRIGGLKLYNMLTGLLERNAIKMGRDMFYRFIKENNLIVRKRKKHKATNSAHHFNRFDNLIYCCPLNI